jgi:hypothetical protein
MGGGKKKEKEKNCRLIASWKYEDKKIGHMGT